jgi:hypothetical protein
VRCRFGHAHCFLLFFRNPGRERLYAVINIGGLALGLASCLILGLYLRDELTYDRLSDRGTWRWNSSSAWRAAGPAVSPFTSTT